MEQFREVDSIFDEVQPFVTDRDTRLSFWDVSIDKTLFQEKTTTDFRSYLKEKGFHLENVQDRFGGKWHYCGLIDMEKVYRIQYYQDNND